VAELTVISWRDIPLQVVARNGRESSRVLLPERFQEAVDAAAMSAGLIGSDDYTEQMRMDRSDCGDDLEAEAQTAADRLQSAWPDDVLRAAIRAGGFRRDAPA
jgi:Virulence factor